MRMNNKTTLAIFIIILAILAIFILTLMGGPGRPVVGEDGRVSGSYSLESIMSLNEPYRCVFEMTDETSIVQGVITTHGEDAFGEFRIRTENVENDFNSFLLIKDKRDAYVWTSLYPFGYQTRAARSAVSGATPAEQSQIIGLRDEVQYDCEPWQNPDDTTFEVPEWITFSEL